VKDNQLQLLPRRKMRKILLLLPKPLPHLNRTLTRKLSTVYSLVVMTLKMRMRMLPMW
jgi:hypothetical protein